MEKNLTGCYSNTNIQYWTVELARFRLAAGGGERTWPYMLLWIVFSFMLGFVWWVCGGKHYVFWTNQKLFSCCGTLREPAKPTAYWLLYKVMRLISDRTFRTKCSSDFIEKTEVFKVLFENCEQFFWYSVSHFVYCINRNDSKFYWIFLTVSIRLGATLPLFPFHLFKIL